MLRQARDGPARIRVGVRRTIKQDLVVGLEAAPVLVLGKPESLESTR